MFDPIKSHIDPYRGPASGVGTEHGDTWPEAVRKINDGFAAVVDWIKGIDPAAAPKDPAAKPFDEAWVASNFVSITVHQEALDAITALQMKVDAMKAQLDGFFVSAPVSGVTGAGTTNAETPQP